MGKLEELKSGIKTAYINSSYNSNLAYRPEFISNDYKQGKKVLVSIEEELKRCEEFCISVAFINSGGITPLLMTLKELEKKGIKGKILTTDYQMFTEPKALDTLASLSNITLKMYRCNAVIGGFHTKGYIFKEDNIYRIIIGSSNMTLSAITKNKEWNTKIVSAESGEIAENIVNEFKQLWNSDNCYEYSEIIEEYSAEYLKNKIIQKQHYIARQEQIIELDKYKLQPNKMQVEFITNLKKMYANGIDRALLLSSTGTGKTYASAFAMREIGFRKVLFLVHRNQIAKQALKSYRKVFGNSVTMGMVSGTLNRMEYDKDYIFATIQTISKDEILRRFDKKHFDAIIYDEAHHTSAGSYKKVMEYFMPKLSLGMTATPDKRDDNLEGRNIYEIFNHNIAYEIRLQQAMQEDLLCPFHYMGITDLEIVDDNLINGIGKKKGNDEELSNFRYLTSDIRVDYILEQARYYGFSGERVKGLMFCSRIDEAKELSRKFNERGLRTVVLSGQDSEQIREDAIERLVMDEEDATLDMQPLDYILSVDIFSEGTDIVEVNQVIMLRPTQSPIVFIQQLGRGLRKTEGKEYVVILDFIGNYKNNFMIPIALSGDRSYNKDTVRRYVMEGGRVIPGCSSIHFDEISKKKIYESIDRLSTPKKMLIDKYMQLKDKLGRIPNILEFYEYGEIDPLLFIQYSGSYHKFLQMADKSYNQSFSAQDDLMLEFVSQYLANGKRVHELLILQQIIRSGEFDKQMFRQELENKYHLPFSEKSYESALRVLRCQFMNTQSEKKKYQYLELVSDDTDRIRFSRLLSYRKLSDKALVIEQMHDVITLGLRRYKDIYANMQDEMGLALYQKYSRKDVCRILNWEKDDSSTIYGYKIKNGTCPIFVTYEKKENIASSTKYEDVFLNSQIFSWMTRSRVSEQSEEAQKLIHWKENGLKILLFIKKSDGEGSDFYYMGLAHPLTWRQTEIYNDAGKKLPIMNFELQLENCVREDIYNYFVS